MLLYYSRITKNFPPPSFPVENLKRYESWLLWLRKQYTGLRRDGNGYSFCKMDEELRVLKCGFIIPRPLCFLWRIGREV